MIFLTLYFYVAFSVIVARYGLSKGYGFFGILISSLFFTPPIRWVFLYIAPPLNQIMCPACFEFTSAWSKVCKTCGHNHTITEEIQEETSKVIKYNNDLMSKFTGKKYENRG